MCNSHPRRASFRAGLEQIHTGIFLAYITVADPISSPLSCGSLSSVPPSAHRDTTTSAVSNFSRRRRPRKHPDDTLRCAISATSGPQKHVRMASSRAPAPDLLYMEKHRTSSSSSTAPQESPVPPQHSRTSSSSSSSSDSSHTLSASSGGRSPSSPRNVYTHCGRHTDQYLFGGKGFGDMWRAITKKE